MSGEASEKRIRRYVNVILATSACLMALLIVLSSERNTTIGGVILLGYTLAGYGLTAFEQIRVVRITFPFVTWLVFTGMMLSGFGLRSIAVTTFPIAILIGALLGGRRVAYLYTTLSILSVLAAWLGEQWGFIDNGMVEKSSLEDLLNLYMVVAFILALIVALMRHVDSDRLEAIRKEERFNVLSSNLHDMVWTTDLALNVEFITPSVENILGYTPDDLIGMSFADIMPIESFDAARDLMKTELDLNLRGLSTDKFKTIQSEVRCKDGTVRWLNAGVSFLHDDSGQIFGTVGSAHDVSEQRASVQQREVLETQLHKAQKMEALGQFAGGIVHDFNNILVAVQGYSDLASQSAENAERAREYTAEIQKAADRASGLTRQLLNYGRGNDSERRPFGINTMIEGIRGMLQRLLPENIRFELDTGDEEPIVDGVPGHFE